ncbi:MAG: hypothetical protein COC19_00520 [SAR86 cluster bacterium]|uniref:Alkyl hydroperoxide reductase subunit C/ Thiol specific antioxidant domain-containing protein n=1 Tax=SAR86 cluster bacterium TaxID=2030880 RepID=A0A2A4MUY0_9GAMM|nr:MAG: hypothetical protein COC19_00520 [SAR86 cluster bacterium]
MQQINMRHIMKKQFLNRFSTAWAILLLSGFLSSALAQDYDWAPDFPVGANIPAIEALDQHGQLRNFDDLVGDKGLILFLNRSFDW